MRKNCTKVVEAFLAGRSAGERSISTDGVFIRSYALPIARRLPGNAPQRVEVLGGRGPTVTTSQHLGQVRALLAQRGVEVVEVAHVDPEDRRSAAIVAGEFLHDHVVHVRVGDKK